jgi:pyruvate/2-oxoglutarate dehydrogenase complex dihydrolipoamide dehydrogenase (E3) component
MSELFDSIVIGTGQAGPSLAVRLAGSGRKTAVIERKRFGGTCVNNGCIPTKTLIASARAAHVARRAADYGVEIRSPVRVDMRKVKERKDSVVAQSNQGLEKWLRSTANLTVIEGHARFESARRVRAGERLLEAPEIFIDVGGRAVIPPVPGLGRVPFLTNSSIMDVDFLPEHLVILGGSYIALEFGQMYRRFGSEVTIVERGPRLVSREDDDVSAAVREIVEGEGVRVLVNSGDFSAGPHGAGVALRFLCENCPTEVAGSHLLVATGRVPNTADLGLDRAGVETDPRGFIKVDDQLRSSQPGIWALGECNGRGAFTHTSYNDYEIVAANLLDGDARRVTDRITAYNLYIDPPLGRCGMTEKEARATGRRLLIGRRPMTRVGRAVEKGETQGFMKVVIDAGTKLILGAAILGVEGDEAIHSILDVMYARAPYTVMQRAVHIHPTVTELIPTMLGELQPAS